MIHVTIFINGTPIHTVKSVNGGPVSPEDQPRGADKEALICWYDLQVDDYPVPDKGREKFMHNRADGALACAYRMLWLADQQRKDAIHRAKVAIDHAKASGADPSQPEPSE